MSPVLAAAGASALGGVLLTLAVLTSSARVHYARHLPSFRCRIGPAAGRRRRRGARWRRRRSSATWVDDVLLVRSGTLRLWLTPLRVGVAPDVTVQSLDARE